MRLLEIERCGHSPHRDQPEALSAEAGIQGIREATSNPIDTLPSDVRDYPDAVAHALSQLRLVGVNGPYSVLLGANEYTALADPDYTAEVAQRLSRDVRADTTAVGDHVDDAKISERVDRERTDLGPYALLVA